jgi:hypothetical protein
LSAKEAAVFNEVVTLAPPNAFVQSDVFLLSTFSRITALIAGAARAAAKADEKTKQIKYKMLAELVKTQCVLATKLRLAPQSRISQITAARQAASHQPSFYDTMRIQS